MNNKDLFDQFDTAGRLEQAELRYEPGTVSILPQGTPHEVLAGTEGVCLFAKFFPALI